MIEVTLIMKNLSQRLKNEWSKLLLGNMTPHSVALGLAIGTFVALLPSFGFSALLALFVIFIFPSINRPAVFVALIVWNPLVQIPLYAASFHLGTYLFADAVLVKYDIEILNQLYSFTRRFLIAHMILISVITVLTYIGTRIAMRYRRLATDTDTVELAK